MKNLSESLALLASPSCGTDVHVLVTYVDEVVHGWGDGESIPLSSEYIPYEDFSSEVDRLEAQLLEMVPERCRGTVTISHITRDGVEIATSPATDA